jgi:hypothetical protein
MILEGKKLLIVFTDGSKLQFENCDFIWATPSSDWEKENKQWAHVKDNLLGDALEINMHAVKYIVPNRLEY